MGECILSRVSSGGGSKILLNQSTTFGTYSNTPSSFLNNYLFQYSIFSSSAAYGYLYRTWTEIAHLTSDSSKSLVTFNMTNSTNSYAVSFYSNQSDIEGILNDASGGQKFAYKIGKNANNQIALYLKLTDETSWTSLGISLGTNSDYVLWIKNFLMLPLN